MVHSVQEDKKGMTQYHNPGNPEIIQTALFCFIPSNNTVMIQFQPPWRIHDRLNI